MADASATPEGRLREYLARLTGKPVEAGASVVLSSARKAQLAAWLRREGIPFQYAQIDRPSVTVADILGGAGSSGGAAPESPAAPRPPSPAADGVAPPTVALPVAGLKVGIDMESASNLPTADDYRTHPFYRENFSAREIAHCLLAGNPRDSLCGLWAAKEAILKAGAALRAGNGALSGIEVTHDGAGAPGFPGCALSISHEAGMAIAVCLNFGRVGA